MDGISDVAQGPGWWLASDGRWYPPHLHPEAAPQPATPVLPGPLASAANPAAPSLPPPVPMLLPAELGKTAPGAIPGGTYGRSDPGMTRGRPGYLLEDDQFGDQLRNRAPASGRHRQSVDARGIFVATTSALLVAACFLPYYTVTGGTALQTTYTVIAHQFGEWRLALLGVAVVTVVVGIANSILRVGQRGAVGVFFTLRFLVIIQLALWIAVIFVHHFVYVTSIPSALEVSVTVSWVAYAGAAVALVGVAGSVSSMGTSDTA